MTRPTCARCLRPQSACLCAWITPTPNEVEVLILQHPLEVHQAKGSARLLQLSLRHSRLVIGECFDARDLTAPTGLAGPRVTDLLLYPAPAGEAVPPPAQIGPEDAGRFRLWVLDGTWRKSRKMLHLNPFLSALPRLALAEPPPSRYRIRKAHRPDQLSTLEATCLALAQLEAAPQRYAPLLDAFDGFVGSQSR